MRSVTTVLSQGDEGALDPLDGSVYAAGSGSNVLGATEVDMWIKKLSIDGSQEQGLKKFTSAVLTL